MKHDGCEVFKIPRKNHTFQHKNNHILASSILVSALDFSNTGTNLAQTLVKLYYKLNIFMLIIMLLHIFMMC